MLPMNQRVGSEVLKSTDFDLALGSDQSCLCFENNEDLKVIKKIIATVL